MRTIEKLLKEEEDKSDKTQKILLGSKDFLGRSVLHLAVLSGSIEACKVLLDHPLVDGKFLQARLSDGRTALHIAAMKGTSKGKWNPGQRGRSELIVCLSRVLMQLRRMQSDSLRS